MSSPASFVGTVDSFANSGSRSSSVVLLSALIGDGSLAAGEDIVVDRERVAWAGQIAEEALASCPGPWWEIWTTVQSRPIIKPNDAI